MRYLPLVLLGVVSCFYETVAQPSIVPIEQIDLLYDDSFRVFNSSLKKEDSLSDRFEGAWSFNEGLLYASGKEWGILSTQNSYRDYHLVIEYKWGEHTFGVHADQARTSGLLIHGVPHLGHAEQSPVQGVEVLLKEGATGLLGKGSKPVGWRDERGFRKQDDVENPVGEWNRLEVICRGGSLSTVLNGESVQRWVDSRNQEGIVALQSQGAAFWVRRLELWPLDQFTESWVPEVPSSDTGMSEVGAGPLPRRSPWSPEQSLAAWNIDGDYEIQLVASEPVVRDPVDVVWDARGRMFVAEMGDYPFPPDPGPLLSRIRLLSDTDGDGRMDLASTWADNLDHVQGMLPMNGGLLITTRTEVLFLKDSDGDNIADERTQLFVSNDPRHSQLQVSSPRWGLDNAIYLNNGLDGMEIYPNDSRAAVVPFRGWDLRFEPRENALARTTGKGQFGGSMDDWGRRFFCSNRNPIMFAVMSVEAMERNPFAAITQGHEDIQEPGASVWPVRISHTTASAHLGTHTAASGLAVYRGDWMPDLTGEIFVCEPTGQLVTRNRLVPNGASFIADRVGKKRDFLTSSDEWTRPVQIRNGPDGALYICDMYRRFIDHARFFPEDFVDTNYMRAGLDHGRIWRLVPKGASPRPIQPLPRSIPGLVELLESKIGWQRTHAQRLLVERQMPDAIPGVEKRFLKSPDAKGRLHALWTLQGLGVLTKGHIERALADPEPGVVENAISLADPDAHFEALLDLVSGENLRLSFLATQVLGSSQIRDRELTDRYLALLRRGGLEDRWIRQAILSVEYPPTAELIRGVIEMVDSEVGGRVIQLADCLREFAAEAAARGDIKVLRRIVSQVTAETPRFTDAPIVEGLSVGLKRSSLSIRSVGEWIRNPPAPMEPQELAGIQSTLESAADVALDSGRSTSDRLAALPLVRERGTELVFEVVSQLIRQTEPPELQAAACRMLFHLERIKVAEFFFDNWASLGPTPRKDALEFLSGSDATAIQLMRHMKNGKINASLMPVFQRWRLARRDDAEVRSLANELFGRISADRAAVIAKYSKALSEQTGDPVRGRQVFEKAACVTCHQIDEWGEEVGPGLADVRLKLPNALLSDILDPNRAVEERWSVYTLETQDGRFFTGLIGSETASSLVMKLPGGFSETVSRDQIIKLETSGMSLMPVGLEEIISVTEMTDLIAFLTQ
jgi:putative membrane-bound dehydrogenase-like protein